MKKFIILGFILSGVCFAEQSVYTDSDFVDPLAVAKKNSTEVLVLKQQISQLKEKIEGLNTIIQGQNSEIAQLKEKVNENNYEKIINQLSQRVAVLENKTDVLSAAKAAPTPVPVTHNSDTVKDDKKSNHDISSAVKKKEVKKTTYENIPNSKLYKDSVLNFTKMRLTKAKDGFKVLYKRGYKKASVNYYLGEIAYKRGNYKDAIGKYQKSATIDENANYMDKLLLHTALSLKKIGKAGEAKVFFKAVVDTYPESISAKVAKKYLK